MPQATVNESKVRSARRRVTLGLMDRDFNDAEVDVVRDVIDSLDDAADRADFELVNPRFDSDFGL